MSQPNFGDFFIFSSYSITFTFGEKIVLVDINIYTRLGVEVLQAAQREIDNEIPKKKIVLRNCSRYYFGFSFQRFRYSTSALAFFISERHVRFLGYFQYSNRHICISFTDRMSLNMKTGQKLANHGWDVKQSSDHLYCSKNSNQSKFVLPEQCSM